jgi:hypothetical protein
MGNLGDSLLRHAKKLGIEKQVKAVGVVEAAGAEIERYIPTSEFEVISFKDGVLKVGVDSATAKNEINLRISSEFKKSYGIKRLRFEQKPRNNQEPPGI